MHLWEFNKDLDTAKSYQGFICDRALERLKRNKYALSTKAESFLNDLNADIETGWTGSVQTNRLIGRIAQRSYIFGHILHSLDRLPAWEFDRVDRVG